MNDIKINVKFLILVILINSPKKVYFDSEIDKKILRRLRIGNTCGCWDDDFKSLFLWILLTLLYILYFWKKHLWNLLLKNEFFTSMSHSGDFFFIFLTLKIRKNGNFLDKIINYIFFFNISKLFIFKFFDKIFRTNFDINFH